ncbi:MAG TPA: bifunctional phosphopantothenoylcysteine decarboxylase/phosphopantothenate--cysteine ligase CoaBC [Burkholderiales bacterium]|nr:bifunctional phosphopantothenoylcysteine decarboxylase/phosphopantothenate--cysteine ligase CoaBC [Burkholderiales bacterium]
MVAMTQNKRLLLGVTGGIAAYKVAELTRLLVQDGVEVQVVMTEAAARFVGPATFQALSGNTVYTDLWDARFENNMAHIDLSRGADLILVAPASADFIAKLVHGRADDLLSTLCLARECPLLVAPAMNRQMWENPATQRNIAQLEQDGATILGPESGEQACGETGMGRMLEPEVLLDDIRASFQPKLLQDKRVLITAGPTFEAIDTVRGITNLSSGKMGYAAARAALEAGARVTLVSGIVSVAAPPGAKLISVTSAQEMFAAVEREVGGVDIFIGVAAVADYRVVSPSKQKIKRSAQMLNLQLAPNPDILNYVASLSNGPFCVGFAAESENLLQHAEQKRREKKIPLLAANLVQDTLGKDESELVLFDDSGAHPLPRAPKIRLARQLIRHIAELYVKSRTVAQFKKNQSGK